jgi:tetratricopeptide (TPR) repeat protein
MIFNTMNGKWFVFPLIVLSLCLVSCQPSPDKTLEADNLKADSLSIKLNSPELKAVNAELLKDPGNAELYNKRALIYLGIKEYEAAVNDAKRAIRLDSASAAYHLTLVDAYFTGNKTRQAKDELELTAKIFPENTEALMKLAELYFLVKQYQKGIDYVNKALKVDAGLARAYYIKGSIYRESGDTTRAISSLETAVAQYNKNEDVFYDVGFI